MRTMRLPVKLTDPEKLQRAKQIAILDHDIGVMEDQRKESNKAMQAKVAKLKAEASDICHQLRTGEEMREVEIHFERDYDRKVEDTIRSDTGEIVETRSLGPRELQQDLPIEDQKADEASADDDVETPETVVEDEHITDETEPQSEASRLNDVREVVRAKQAEMRDPTSDEDPSQW
jgi:hypothetical protein